MKAFTDDKKNISEKLKIVFGRVENIVGKGENAIKTLLFPQCFRKVSFPGSRGKDLTVFPKRQILDSSKLKEFADDNSKLDENGRKFFKRVENTVGEGKSACYEQFLLDLDI